MPWRGNSFPELGFPDLGVRFEALVRFETFSPRQFCGWFCGE
jgi:hypothetical protein